MYARSKVPQKIRVAVVIPTHWDYRMGGSQYQAKLLIQELYQSYGTSITYFAARAGRNRNFPDHQVVSVGRINSLRRFGHFWDYFRLQSALEAFEPHVIYQRVGCAYTGISVRYSIRSGAPMIWHVASESDCQKMRAVNRMLGRPHALIEAYLANLGATHSSVVVAQSNDQVRMLHENFGRHADRMIRNFHQAPPVADKRSDLFTVLWIANFKPIKRPELFLEIASFFDALPGIEFLMIGQSYPSGPMKADFDRMVKSHTNVSYLGAMSQDEVNGQLERAHLLVNTSKSEGFSNTFIQAWLRCVPVLTLGVNPDDLLDNNFLGSSHESTTGIADHIRELMARVAELDIMGRASRQYAMEHFSMRNAAELAELVVQTAINGINKSTGELE